MLVCRDFDSIAHISAILHNPYFFGPHNPYGYAQYGIMFDYIVIFCAKNGRMDPNCITFSTSHLMKPDIDVLKKGLSKPKLLVKSWDPSGLYSAPLPPPSVPISNLRGSTCKEVLQAALIVEGYISELDGPYLRKLELALRLLAKQTRFMDSDLKDFRT